MTIENPLVTVYLPTFNRLELLQRAVKSVQDQTYQNIEIIIVDDCSIDGTQEYLEDLEKRDQRVRYFLKEKNSGACVSRNIAIQNAKGLFITGLDDDDYFLDNRIQCFIENVHILDNYAFLCSKSIYKTNQGLKIGKFEKIKPREISSKDLLSINYIGNQIFIKTQIFRNNLFNPEMPAWQDLYNWYKILGKNKKAYILDNYSYIVDVSHDHERISGQKIEKIKKAYELFCNHYNLNYFQRCTLKAHLINYDFKEKKYKCLIISLFYSKTLYNFLYVSYRLLKLF